MKNYIFLNLEDIYSLNLKDGGSYARVMLDFWSINQEDLGNDEVGWASLVILKKEKIVVFKGNITQWQIGSELLIYAEKDENEPEELDWRGISKDPNLTEEFIEKHKDDLNWYELSCHYPMTEEFMDKYAGRLNWSAICYHQKLSEDFIERNKDRVVWYALHHRQNLSDEFVEKYRRRMENVL